MKIAFIGLGIMGSRMAANLIKGGKYVTAFNRSKSAMDALATMGAKTAESVDEAVVEADLVISMLSNPEVVEEVMISRGLAAMKKGSIWMDSSTVNPSFVTVSAKVAASYGVHYLDAPVAGSKPQAENKELIFLVGGAETLVKKLESTMLLMGSKVLHIGEVGKGASFKMLVNMMLGQSMAIFSEALLLGEKMGINKDFLLNTIPNLPVIAPFTKMKAENIRNDQWEEQFPLELMHKDLNLVSITGDELNQPLHINNVTKELYGQAKKQGLGREDMSAIYKHLNS